LEADDFLASFFLRRSMHKQYILLTFLDILFEKLLGLSVKGSEARPLLKNREKGFEKHAVDRLGSNIAPF
jgi:hypothetical protein